MKTFSLFVLLFFISVGFASAQDQTCSSINDMKIAKGAKSLLLSQCKANGAKAAAGGSKFTSSTKGDFLNISDNSADLGSCGHPSQDFYFESGFQKYSDSNGGTFNGPYVYIFFKNYDCDGNIVGEAGCFTGVPDGAVQLTPFETATVISDLDIECSDGTTLHLTTNITVTAEGFTNLDKHKSVNKRETFNETNNYSEKWRSTTSLGQVIWNGHSYDLSQNGRIGNFKSKFSHEDF